MQCSVVVYVRVVSCTLKQQGVKIVLVIIPPSIKPAVILGCGN